LTQIDAEGNKVEDPKRLTAAELNAEYSDTKIDSAAPGAASASLPESANLADVVQAIGTQIDRKVTDEVKKLVVELNRLKAELKDVATSIKEVGNQLEDLPKSLKGKRAGRKANVKK
jgi:predicted transcriptional regulator